MRHQTELSKLILSLQNKGTLFTFVKKRLDILLKTTMANAHAFLVVVVLFCAYFGGVSGKQYEFVYFYFV